VTQKELDDLAASMGGTLVTNPDEIDKLAASMGGQVQTTQAQTIPEPGARQMASQAPNPGEGTAEGAMGAVVRGAGPQTVMTGINPALGAIYGGTMAVMNPLTELLNTILPPEAKQLPPAQGVEWLLSQLGVAEPKTAAERILQAGAAGAAGAAGQVGAGQALQQGRELGETFAQGIGGRLAASPLQQGASGVGAGLAGQSAAEGGADPLTQGAASLAGGAVGGMAGAGRQPAFPKAMETADADKAGIRVLTSDVFPPRSPGAKLAQTLSERNPFFGTGPVRAGQQKERVDAVRNILRDFGADDVAASSDAVMSDLLAKRSADLGKWSKAKDEVIDRLAEVGGTVKVDKTTQAIDSQIAKLQGMKTEKVAPVIADLEDFKKAIQGQDIRNIEELRRQLGESYKAPEMAAIRSTGEKALSSIYGPLREDMGGFIREKGIAQDFTKWSVANKELSKMMEDLDVTAMKSALTNGDSTPEVIQRMLFAKEPSKISLLYKNLTPEGRANARSAILAKVAEDSLSSGTDIVSPDKFSNAVKKMGNSIGVFFSGDDLEQVKGLTRALDLTKHASEATANPQTGIQTLIPVGGIGAASAFGGGWEGFLGAMAAGTGIGGVTRLYESPAVRNLLVKLAKTNPDGEAETRIFNQLMATARAEETRKQSPSDRARAYQSQGAQQ
jgi:hypothetical protein